MWVALESKAASAARDLCDDRSKPLRAATASAPELAGPPMGDGAMPAEANCQLAAARELAAAS